MTSGTTSSKKQLRGFIISYVESEKELKQPVGFKISPILAQSEEEALNYIKQQGKFPTSITTLELLELQVGLIHNLATQQNIQILRTQEFSLQS